MMTNFNTITRSIIVLLAIGLIFISVNVEKYISQPSMDTVENPVERLFGITRPQEIVPDESIQDDDEIFGRKNFAYLADDRSTGPQALVSRPIGDTTNRLIVARNLAKRANYDKALDILSNVKPADMSSYDVRMMKARIISSAGDFERAEQIFQTLRGEFPHDPDLMVAYGHHYFNQGRFTEAENLFSKTLVEYPGYSDAEDGLTRVRQARQ